jgi:hypothetical protein
MGIDRFLYVQANQVFIEYVVAVLCIGHLKSCLPATKPIFHETIDC